MQDLVVKGFSKVNEAKDPELLDPTELQVLSNMVLDKKAGIPVKRGGWTQFNTNTAGADIVALHDVADVAGTNYVLAMNSNTLQASPAGTGAFATIKTTASSGLKTRIAAIRPGEYVVTNGTDEPFVIKTAGFASAPSLYITAPDVSSVTTTPNTAGSMGNGFYRYLLIYIDTTGQYSLPSKPIHPMATSRVTLAGANDSLDFANLPTNSAMRTRWLFRTTNAGKIYYFLADIGNTATTYSDTTADSALDTSLFFEYCVQPKFSYLTTHRERLFAGKTTTSVFVPELMPRYSGAISAITGTPTTIGGGGLQPSSTYKYRFYMVDLDGNLGDYIGITVVTGVADNEIDIANLPFVDTTKYNIAIYRTPADDNSYYKLTTITNNTPDYVDIIPDGSLGAALPASINVSYDSAVMFSIIGKYGNILAENIIQIYPDGGDVITGIFDDGDGVIVFKQNSIAKIYTSGSPENWRVSKLVENVGATQPNAICKNGNQYFFISNGRAYILAGSLTNVGETFKTTLATITNWYDICYNPQKQWYMIACKATSTYYILVYDTKIDTWYKFTVPSGDTYAIAMKSVSGTGAILMGSDAYLMTYTESATPADVKNSVTTQINTEIKTKVFGFKDGITLARLRKIWLNYSKRASLQIDTTIYDPSQSNSVAYYDSTSSGEKFVYLITDAMLDGGNLKTASKLYFDIQGQGLDEFYSLKFAYRPLRRNRDIGN